VRFCAFSPSRHVQNFRPISEEIKNRTSIFEIAIAPQRNAMRARYKDRLKKSTNAVGMITALQIVMHCSKLFSTNMYCGLVQTLLDITITITS